MDAHVKETPSEPKANDGLHKMPTKAEANITDLPPDVCLLIIESMWSWRDQWSARLSCRALYLGYLKRCGAIICRQRCAFVEQMNLSG